ncbi:MAG: ABC transporter substrate-binding protein [Synergistaceae bacterium]|jgi:branched-chain amino acid transport system substrate-binding protein|nr:ABC transporter substrate-binding protein [Synergistaceae bacterium]
MKKFAVLFVLLALLAITLGGADKAFAAPAPIKVGQLCALTGDFAGYGNTEANAVKMALKEINAKGGVLGRPFEVIVYDNKSRVEDNVNASRRLIDSDGVVAILGPQTSGMAMGMSAVVNDRKIPQLAHIATNPLVTVDEKGAVRPFVFRICFTDPYAGLLAAEFAVNDLNVKEAAVLYDVSSEYAQGLREFFVANFEKLGGKIVADEGYRLTDVDFRAQLTKIKETGAKVLFVPGYGKDMALIIKQAQELSTGLTVLGSDGYAAFMNEIAGDAMKGTIWVNHMYEEDPALQRFFADYKKEYNDECKEYVTGILAYECLYWLADAITRAGTTDGPAVAKALEETKGLQLMHAVLTIDPKTHTPLNKAGIILKVDDNLVAKFFKKVEPK